MKSKSLATLVFGAMLVATVASAATWKVDPVHSNVQFSVKHMMVTPVRGSFGTFNGTATFDEKNPADLALEGTIDATTISTQNDRRDAHLKSADFFDVAKYPTITFKSTKAELVAPGQYRVTGDLTLHGVTKPVTLSLVGLTDFVNAGQGKTITGATLSGTINRKDWGLSYNKALEAGGVAVSDSVKIEMDAELNRSE